MKNKIILIGSGGFAVSIIEIILDNGYEINYIVDERAKTRNIMGVKVKKSISYKDTQNLSVIIAKGDNFARFATAEKLMKLYKNINFPSIIDKSSVISKSARIGKGSIIMSGAFIGVNTTISNFCFVNTKASIDHESCMKDYSSLAPRVATGGKVCIGKRSAVCIGATIKDKTSISFDTIVGACSYVNMNLKNNSVYYGNPAKFVRKRKKDDPYL